MDRQVVQARLEALYTDWKALMRFSQEEADSLGPPLLLNVTEDYCRAERRVLLYGQETYGWVWDSKLQATYPGYPCAWRFGDLYSCADFLTNPDSIEALCWGYGEFQFGARQKLSRTPFWQAFNEVCKWPSVGVMWSNVVRMDYGPPLNKSMSGVSICQASPQLRDSLISQHVSLVAAELAILDPHICLFFSGPYYDEFIAVMLPGCEFVACTEVPARELAKLIHPSLPTASFRTFHPAFLSRGNRWHYIERLRALA